MSKFIDALNNVTETENGAVAFKSSFDKVLDLFALIGNMRHTTGEKIIEQFKAAYEEDKNLALKCLFYSRDIRGGLGERRTFRIISRWLANLHSEEYKQLLPLIAEYGRWDDLFDLIDTNCKDEVIEICKSQLVEDLACLTIHKNISLMAKWMPSINTSSMEARVKARALCKGLGLTEKKYRKTLSVLRKEIKIIENNLREKDYTFEYDKQPSKAMLKYRAAFARNDRERYMSFLESVEKGEKSMNTSTLNPYDIVGRIIERVSNNWLEDTMSCDLSEEDRKSLDVTWNQLENYAGSENALVVLDGSGSMYGYSKPSPAAVAQSLAIYYAERNTGEFRNHFITFSEHPRLVKIEGEDITEKVMNNMKYDECANTNIAAVFDLLLSTARRNGLSEEDMPKKLYIVSDMQFDYMTSNADLSMFEYAKKKYEKAGFALPQIVFWNVDARDNMQVPVTKNEQGCALVSGFSSQIFNMLKDDILDPLDFMMKTLSQERYAPIHI